MEFEAVTSKEGDKTSVWHYFLRNKSKSEAKCKTCHKVMKATGGSTSSLQRHLKNLHKIDLETERCITINTPRPATSQNSAFTSINSPEEPKKKTKLTHYFETDAYPSMQVMVSRMAAVDGIPLRTFAKSQDLKYLFERTGNKLPTTADTIRNIILKECDKRKLEFTNEIKTILQDEKKFSISFDEWTSNHNRRYIGLTLHSQKFSRTAFRNLGLIRIHGSMNAASCVQLIGAKLDEFGVSLTNDIIAQTTDGCSLMVAFGKSLKSYHQLCIAHAIQLAIVDVMYKRNEGSDEDVETYQGQGQFVELYDDEDLPLSVLAHRLRSGDINDDTADSTDNDDDSAEFNNEPLECFSSLTFRFHDLLSKVRKVVKMFKNSPTKNDDILQKYVRDDFGQEYSLLLDGKTRWSSIAVMLNRFLKLKTCITKALIDLNTHISFTDDEWKNIDELHKILDVIKTVVEALCRRDATLLTADVTLKFALKKMEQINTPLSSKVAIALRQRYSKRRLTQAATLQYLTNPQKYFENMQNDDATVFFRPTSDDMLHEMVNLIKRTSKKQTLFVDQEQDLQRIDNTDIQLLTNEEELNKELSQAVDFASQIRPLCPSDDLLSTVRVEMALFENDAQQQRGHYLSLVFEHLKTIPPTSVEPERIFSSAGIVCNRLRSSLSDKTLSALIFLRSYYISKKKN